MNSPLMYLWAYKMKESKSYGDVVYFTVQPGRRRWFLFGPWQEEGPVMRWRRVRDEPAQLWINGRYQ